MNVNDAPKWCHPGTFMSPEMTRTLKVDSQTNEVRSKALVKLINETPLDYTSQALEVVNIGYNGVGNGHKEATKDGEQAVSAAILYWATDNKTYAQMAVNIIKNWSNKNKVWKGDNAILEASWSVCSLARAAELLKYAKDSSVVSAWKAIEPSFYKWIDTVIMPVLTNDTIWKWTLIGNWHFSQICARMQLAILRENKQEFTWCVQHYRQGINSAIISKRCQGEISETCRDVTHAQFLLGGLIQAPEMALHQGVKLYDDRLVQVFELQARIMMKEIPNGFTKDEIRTPYGYWQEPVWCIAQTHFVGRKKKEMPHTEAYIKQIGPEKVTFHWGPCSLTHFNRCH